MKIAKRLASSTPSFFKRMQVFGAALLVLSITLLKINGVPLPVTHVAEHLAWIGPVIIAVSQFAVENYV